MNKKYAVLFSTLLMAAALSGAAYAHWFKIITIDGSVDTGYLHVYPWLELDPLPKKDGVYEVAYWDMQYCDLDGKEDNYVKFVLMEVYPCLEASMTLWIENDGSIPAGLKSLDFVGSVPSGVAYEIFDLPTTEVSPYFGALPAGPGYYIQVWNTDPDYDYMGGVTTNDDEYGLMAEVVVTWLTTEPMGDWDTNSLRQVDPGCKAHADIKVHFDEALPMDTTFNFGFKLEYWNWNEVEYV